MSVIGNILFQSLSHDLSVCVCVTCETERRVRRQSPGQYRTLTVRTDGEVTLRGLIG